MKGRVEHNLPVGAQHAAPLSPFFLRVLRVFVVQNLFLFAVSAVNS